MRILIVEDEPKIAAAIKRGLELKGYAADTTGDSDSGLSHGLDADYDLIILDRMLPGSMDGAEVAAKIREAGVSTPILMLTARGEVHDRVEGLQAGADDYLIKPFAFEELVARVQALLRRPKAQLGNTLRAGELELDPAKFKVQRAGQEIDLSQKEFALLEYLLRHAGQIVSKDTLISHVWDGEADVLPNTVEVYIGYLRNKIDKPFKGGKPLIHTKRGFGYKISAE